MACEVFRSTAANHNNQPQPVKQKGSNRSNTNKTRRQTTQEVVLLGQDRIVLLFVGRSHHPLVGWVGWCLYRRIGSLLRYSNAYIQSGYLDSSEFRTIYMNVNPFYTHRYNVTKHIKNCCCKRLGTLQFATDRIHARPTHSMPLDPLPPLSLPNTLPVGAGTRRSRCTIDR